MKWKLKMKSIWLCSAQDIRLIGITFSHTFLEMFKKIMNNDAVDKFIFLMKLNGKHYSQLYFVSICEFRESIIYTND